MPSVKGPELLLSKHYNGIYLFFCIPQLVHALLNIIFTRNFTSPTVTSVLTHTVNALEIIHMYLGCAAVTCNIVCYNSIKCCSSLIPVRQS